jgi:hypothetical protein
MLMYITRPTVLALALLLSACSASVPHDVARKDAVVTASARGWNLKPGENNSTIVVFPDGHEQNVGQTQYPDITTAQLYKIKGPELKGEYLVLYVPPVASGGATMTVFEIEGESVNRHRDIDHRYEFRLIPNQANDPRVGVVDTQDGIALRRLVFPNTGDEEVMRLRDAFEWPFLECKAAR